jgi:hypothetical protein
MSRYKIQQRQLPYRGKVFHFVSYEGEPPNPSKLLLGTSPTWFLMTAGKRWPVMTEEPGMSVEELDRHLTEWLEANVFSKAPAQG